MYTYLHMYIQTYLHIYTYVYIYMYLYTDFFVYTHIYMHIYMCIYLYTHMHVYIYPVYIFVKNIIFHRGVALPFPPTSEFGMCVWGRGVPLFLLWGGFD